MSGSDPTSSNLNLSTGIVQGCVGEVNSMRARNTESKTPTRNGSRQKAIQSGGPERRPVATSVKSLPKAFHSQGPSPSHRGGGSIDVPMEVHHHRELHVHDDRSDTVAMRVDPVEYGRMVGEAHKLFDESQSRADHIAGLSKEIYSQTCEQVP